MYNQSEGQLGEAGVWEARRAEEIRAQSRGGATPHTRLR